jgi:lipopolysaccharide export system protein LptA
MTRRIPAHVDSAKKRASEQVQHAVADRAAYDGSKDQLTLSGAVQINDSSSAMWTREVTFDRPTGDAHAVGPVKVDYKETEGSRKEAADAMHVTAERADMSGSDSAATFYGKPVRVWQGGNQIQAPEVQIERSARRLIARAAENSAEVRTILVGAVENGGAGQQSNAPATEPRCGTAQKTAGAGGSQPTGSSVVRIASGALVYSGGLRQVEFTGGVRADTPDATVRATEATAFLAGERQTQSSAVPTIEGGVEKIVARGPVEVARPGTSASGEKLVYEARTRTFVLSGSARGPAKATDVRGTTTAAAFRFSACDDRLEALGEAPGAPTQRVNTDAVASGAKKRERAER